MLELEGLVVVVPRRGVEVAKITEKDLCDALEIRMALEELAVGLACDRITEEGRENYRKPVFYSRRLLIPSRFRLL